MFWGFGSLVILSTALIKKSIALELGTIECFDAFPPLSHEHFMSLISDGFSKG